MCYSFYIIKVYQSAALTCVVLCEHKKIKISELLYLAAKVKYTHLWRENIKLQIVKQRERKKTKKKDLHISAIINAAI